MPRRKKETRPEAALLELITQHADARVEEEKLYREVIFGVEASIDLHSVAQAERTRLYGEITTAVYELAGHL